MSQRSYPISANEDKRLRALRQYELLDTVPEEEYDRITKIAAGICHMPVSMMSLVDDQRQWFKSTFGFPVRETPREVSFCNYTILDSSRVLVVEDLRLDPRFANNPLVHQDPFAVFYAGAPLITPKGYVLGSICVLDNKTNTLDNDQQEALQALSQQVMNSLELRKSVRKLSVNQEKLKKSNKRLHSFARLVSHDIKTPIANIALLAGTLQNDPELQQATHHKEMIGLIDRSADAALVFIDEVLRQATGGAERAKQKRTSIRTVVHDIRAMLGLDSQVEIRLDRPLASLPVDRTTVQQILQNLITNAIKYNQQPQVRISISCVNEGSQYRLTVADNGCGIAASDLPKLFRRSATLHQVDRFGKQGTGLGLYTIKNMVEAMGGVIDVSSELHVGSKFHILFPALKSSKIPAKQVVGH